MIKLDEGDKKAALAAAHGLMQGLRKGPHAEPKCIKTKSNTAVVLLRSFEASLRKIIYLHKVASIVQVYDD
jgi:hypothetical protein